MEAAEAASQYARFRDYSEAEPKPWYRDCARFLPNPLPCSNAHERALLLLFAACILRMFSFGAVTVVLFLLLESDGLDSGQIGLLLSLILAGDLAITFVLTTTADRFGRRRTLVVGAVLAAFAALVFGTTSNFFVLGAVGAVGVITPSGKEVGPFVSVEQAAIADVTASQAASVRNTRAGQSQKALLAEMLGRYQCASELARAVGAVAAGVAVSFAQSHGLPATAALRLPLLAFFVAAVGKAGCYALLPRCVEAVRPASQPLTAVPCGAAFGLARRESCALVTRLSVLFGVDAFAGGLTTLPFLALWFRRRWGMPVAQLGALVSGCNVVAGLSGLLAGRLVARFGAVETMVFTHLPSNVLLALVPLMPSQATAVGMLLLRFCISQMDVPARQTYVATAVPSDERSAAGGLTNIARSVGLLASPLLLSAFLSAPPASPFFDAPFYVSGALKGGYDLAIWASVRRLRPEAVT